MNKDIIQGKWTQYKGMALKTWGRLTHDDMDVIEGREEELVGRLQERYGWAKDEAQAKVRSQIAQWDKPIR